MPLPPALAAVRFGRVTKVGPTGPRNADKTGMRHARTASRGWMLWAACGCAAAQQLPPLPDHPEAGPHAWLTQDARFAIDLSARAIWSDRTDEFAAVSALGIDYHKTFSVSGRNVGTLIFQTYLTRFDNAAMRPPFVEGPDDWELVWRIANFNADLFGNQTVNVRAGHLELTYGLETLYDTNGTIWDFDLGRKLGVKADWGAGVNGIVGDAEYEINLTRGTGNEWSDRGNPFALSGRIGTYRSGDVVIGVSGFHGDVGQGIQVRRSLGAVDATVAMGSWSVLAELGGGEIGGNGTVDGRWELDWANQDNSLFAYGLARTVWREDATGSWDESVQLGLGALFRPDTHWDFSFEVRQDVETMGGADRNTSALAQARVRF